MAALDSSPLMGAVGYTGSGNGCREQASGRRPRPAAYTVDGRQPPMGGELEDESCRVFSDSRPPFELSLRAFPFGASALRRASPRSLPSPRGTAPDRTPPS